MQPNMPKTIQEESLERHATLRGKLETISKSPVNSMKDLSLLYSPGVAAPCLEIVKDPENAYKYTSKSNTVAVVSDGSAVLGLGNIGPLAAMPVMEGKALLFKEFADINAVPICLDTQDDAEIIRTVKLLAPNFGGINLEDIAAPRCFAIERALQKELDIPVFHDDQHGTAICTLAALINASKVVGKPIKEMSIVINGIGAAGSAIADMLLEYGVSELLLVDRNGILNPHDSNTMLNENHTGLALTTNRFGLKGELDEAIVGADVFIGVSKAGVLTHHMITEMAEKPIIFAMANPEPEIMPDAAKAAGAFIVGTGRSDFPNQINNVLAFPGIFKGALEARVPRITDEMKFAAAHALANIIPENALSPDNIIPSALDKTVAQVVANAVVEVARKGESHARFTPIDNIGR